jgi:hypothetical protein
MMHIGNETLKITDEPVKGSIVTFDEKPYYRIENFDRMPPFFISVISDSDIWMFISSTGALTAGRRNPDNALFPYYNDDRIHDDHNSTGSKTFVRITLRNKTYLWEPLSDRYKGLYNTTRNIYKRPLGNDIIFEEINHDLKLRFIYQWTNCDRFGIVRRAKIINENDHPVTVEILDGIRNILPAGVDRNTQLTYSTLLDGYKKNELITESGVGVYRLSSLLTDKAEPAESLRSTLVWSAGIRPEKILLSSIQLDDFRLGRELRNETDIRARRGAYFINTVLDIKKDSFEEWYILADLKQDANNLSKLLHFLNNESKPTNTIRSELLKSSEALEKIVARGDGMQMGRDQQTTFRHFSETLFNIMRGGIFENNYLIDRNDFLKFIRTSNTQLFNKYKNSLENLPLTFNHDILSEFILNKDPDLERLSYEYLPLSFSRRHGDPSRPWNDFSIDIMDDHGERTLNYQGNWRDVFQNWEALALSFPEFIEGMISKFVNSTTADGYNPYRLTRDGFDWEAPDPDMPFANIGYWGDHQVVYLLKLLKLSHKYHPGKLQNLLDHDIFTYAQVPYKIKSYESMLTDPYRTIDFDREQHQAMMDKIKHAGTDAQRMEQKDGAVLLVNLTEKLLVPLLTKLSNFIPGAGIWMNTQRPEWNDANNALVGHGVSMVTLYYLRDHIDFLIGLFEKTENISSKINQNVYAFFVAIKNIFEKYRDIPGSIISDEQRKLMMDDLGMAGSDYRESVYKTGFTGERNDIQITEIMDFLKTALKHIDHSIELNKRDDGLYHAYNVINISDATVTISRLNEMLEGQVALLSSGYLSAKESLDILRSLRKSDLYREDQRSYILYPDRNLPRFLEKNIIPETLLHTSSYLMNDRSNALVNKDSNGLTHFNASFSNAHLLKQTLDELSEKEPSLTEEEKDIILDIYETIFDHRSFTGRSGTFYKYEGLGCIYWHMASKLLLAVQDTYYRAMDNNEDIKTLNALKNIYYEVREGIGSHKNPDEYGAFPIDPYSHTPGYSGVQQPGMTGQTKEDILARFGELGVRIENGEIHFLSALLKDDEFLSNSKVFDYYDVENKKQTLMLGENMLAFTLCQVPVIYIKSDMDKMIITLRDGSEKVLDGSLLPASYSSQLFQRNNHIIKIHVLMKLL